MRDDIPPILPTDRKPGRVLPFQSYKKGTDDFVPRSTRNDRQSSFLHDEFVRNMPTPACTNFECRACSMSNYCAVRKFVDFGLD
jgi:hypothetical protein